MSDANEDRPTVHPCPYCRKAGMTHILTPVGKKLECGVCGNVYWASDPRGQKSQNSLTPCRLRK